MSSPYFPPGSTGQNIEIGTRTVPYQSMESYHVIATISLEGKVYDYRPELIPPRINPLLVDATERAEFGGLLHRIREPQISVTRWI